MEPRLRYVLRHTIQQFPPAQYRRVADVGGAGGRTAVPLMRAGYKVTIIDPAVHTPFRTMPPWRVDFPRLPKSIVRVPRKFLVRDAHDFDLLFGLCPCGASSKLVAAAKYKPLALVPCWCRHAWTNHKKPTNAEVKRAFAKQGLASKRRGRFFWSRPK